MADIVNAVNYEFVMISAWLVSQGACARSVVPSRSGLRGRQRGMKMGILVG